MQRGELDWATNTNERTAAGYFPANWDVMRPPAASIWWREKREVRPGIELLHTPGHTPYHQSVKLTSGGETAVFLADVTPTAAHLPSRGSWGTMWSRS